VLLALAGLGISAVFLWLAVRDADLSAVRKALQNARIGLVVLTVLVLGLVYCLQAARWERIADAPRVPLRRFYGMLLSGIACNNVLPVRIGELLRARWLSHEAPMPGGRALGSVALDRACDVVTLAVFLAIGVQAVASTEWLVRLAVGTLAALALIAGALVFSRRYSASRGRDRLARGRVRRIIRDTIETLGQPIGRRRAALWMGLSFGAWTLGTVSVWLIARSVGIDLSAIEAVFVTSSLALGVAIPSSPGYIGTYQWVGVASLGLLDIPVEQALAFTILMQASWYIPTTLVGGAILGVRALRSA
jgi:uncharacterized protein (TIRG00374 family)